MRGIAPRVAAVALLASLLQASGARAAVQERWRLRLDGDDGEDDGRAATQSWEVDTAFDVPLNDPDALGASFVDDPHAPSSLSSLSLVAGPGPLAAAVRHRLVASGIAARRAGALADCAARRADEGSGFDDDAFAFTIATSRSIGTHAAAEWAAAPSACTAAFGAAEEADDDALESFARELREVVGRAVLGGASSSLAWEETEVRPHARAILWASPGGAGGGGTRPGAASWLLTLAGLGPRGSPLGSALAAFPQPRGSAAAVEVTVSLVGSADAPHGWMARVGLRARGRSRVVKAGLPPPEGGAWDAWLAARWPNQPEDRVLLASSAACVVRRGQAIASASCGNDASPSAACAPSPAAPRTPASLPWAASAFAAARGHAREGEGGAGRLAWHVEGSPTAPWATLVLRVEAPPPPLAREEGEGKGEGKRGGKRVVAIGLALPTFLRAMTHAASALHASVVEEGGRGALEWGQAPRVWVRPSLQARAPMEGREGAAAAWVHVEAELPSQASLLLVRLPCRKVFPPVHSLPPDRSAGLLVPGPHIRIFPFPHPKQREEGRGVGEGVGEGVGRGGGGGAHGAGILGFVRVHTAMPDASMPYNVCVVTSTWMAMHLGVLLRALGYASPPKEGRGKGRGRVWGRLINGAVLGALAWVAMAADSETRGALRRAIGLEV